jgi:phosphoglycolate phosphatase-like HAD superfamily hydrolase
MDHTEIVDPSADLGPAPIVDFDGTLVSLPVDWPALRERLRVARIDDLWRRDGPASRDAWSEVMQAEVAAAARAHPVDATVNLLGRAEGFAVLTSNSGRAVERFLEDRTDLSGKVVAIVGREALGGPKHDLSRFSDGFSHCAEATAPLRGRREVVYVGDQAYELDFARRLGARAVDVAALGIATGGR